jgi:hypothetical protein
MTFNAGKLLLEEIRTRLRNVARPFLLSQRVGVIDTSPKQVKTCPKGAQRCAPFGLPKNSPRRNTISY